MLHHAGEANVGKTPNELTRSTHSLGNCNATVPLFLARTTNNSPTTTSITLHQQEADPTSPTRTGTTAQRRRGVLASPNLPYAHGNNLATGGVPQKVSQPPLRAREQLPPVVGENVTGTTFRRGRICVLVMRHLARTLGQVVTLTPVTFSIW